MLTGSTTYHDALTEQSLTITCEFTQDGQFMGLGSIADSDGDEFGPEHSAAIYYGLPASVRDQIEAECWDDAEPECDDAGCDDARAP